MVTQAGQGKLRTLPQSDAEVFAGIARVLQGQKTAALTLQKIVELAPASIPGCDHAAISLVIGARIVTPAATGPVPVAVDRLQYAAGEGPCLDAIRHHQVYVTDDLAAEARWPLFSARVAAETGVRSMLSFRLFLDQDTLGSLNLYSAEVAAFGADSQASGAVFAAHAAVAMASAREHDRARALQTDLTASEDGSRQAQAQALVAVELQRSMLPELAEFAPFTIAARYVPPVAAAQVGGDWYDAFPLREGTTALVMGDVAGHDLDAAVRMGQLRGALRTLAVDSIFREERAEPPGELLRRLDLVAEHLSIAETVTCVYAQLDPPTSVGARLRFANAGHPPPLLINADGKATFLQTPDHLLLGSGLDLPRSTTSAVLPPGSTLLLYTDGLIERHDENLDVGLERLRTRAATLAQDTVESICDALLGELAGEPDDDVCLLAVRIP